MAPRSENDPNSPTTHNFGTPSTVHSVHETSTPKENGGDARSRITSPDIPAEKVKEPEKDVEKEKDGDATKSKEKSDETPKSAEEVEALSDLMCSLVTNNCGETRYIGKLVAQAC